MTSHIRLNQVKIEKKLMNTYLISIKVFDRGTLVFQIFFHRIMLKMTYSCVKNC